MKPKTPRDLALNVLNGLKRNVFSGDALDKVYTEHPYLDPRDRAFINHLVQGVLRWRLRLDWIIQQSSDFPLKKIAPPVLNILRLALYQIFFMDRVPVSAAVNEAVKQAKRRHRRHIVSFVNGILRTICRNQEGISYPDPDQDLVHYLSAFYSYPSWLISKWMEELGPKATEALLEAGNRIPFITIRTNITKISRDVLLKKLAAEGIQGKTTPYAPAGIILDPFRGGVEALTTFREGLFQVQDEAAQITSHILGPKSGATILDICSGLGGKASHLAELMGGEGRVVSLDIDHGRLINLRRNAGRLEIDGILPIVADASRPLTPLFRVAFDRILIDAPCSGLGVLSRHPDGKWHKNRSDIERLSELQYAILDRAALLLKKGGCVLYVTCTLSREENEGVIRRFLEKREEFRLENIGRHLPSWGQDLVNEEGFFKTLPHVHHMDGFFAALFVKH